MSDVPYDKGLSGRAAPDAGNIPHSVATRLDLLRRRIIAWFLVDGLGWVLWLVVTMAIVDLALDYAFRMDRAQRGVMWVLMLAGFVAMIVWRLVRPLSNMPSDDALCLEVEGKNKQLGQSVISSVQFSRMGDLSHQGVSMSMVNATIDAGTRAAESVDFGTTLDAKRFQINLALLAGAVLVVALGIVGVASNSVMGLWFKRNMLLQNVNWPEDIELEIVGVEDGKVKRVAGDTWTQMVRITKNRKSVPVEVYIDFSSTRSQPSQKLNRKNQAEGEDSKGKVDKDQPLGEYVVVFKNKMDQFKFRARARDNTRFWHKDIFTDWVAVELEAQPAFEEITLEVTPPKYAGGKRKPLPPGKGPYYVLKGSSLSLSGKTNKSLQEAVLKWKPQDPNLSEKAWPLKIAQSVNVSGSVPPDELVRGSYVIDLKDVGGLSSNRPTSFRLNIKLDRPPRVQAKLFGISGMVVPQAMIPMTVRVKDDYAVTDVGLKFAWHGEEGDSATDQGEVEFGGLTELLGKQDVEFNEVFDLDALENKLEPGITLTFAIEATDNDNISGPNIGKTPEFLLRVVTEEALRTDLLRREKEQRQEFERLLKNQEDLLTDCQALAADVRDKGQFSKNQKDDLRGFQKRQKVIGTNIATVSQRLETFIIEAQNNRLEEEDGPFQRRLVRRIIEPMVRLAEDDVPGAEDGLHKTRRLDSEGADREAALKERDAALDQVLDQQKLIAAKMREILTHMVKAEGFQEAINMLYEIEKSQKGVADRTSEELQELIRRILEQGGDAKLPKKDKDENESNDKSPDE